MAKSARRREAAIKLLHKWKRLRSHFDFVSETSLSLGKIFKQDPLDCGNPQCQLCHREKVFRKPRNNTIRYLPDGER